MEIELKGKRVLVTGGNSGIGEAMALAFAALALEANVAEEQQVLQMLEKLDKAWDGIDILLDNAGIDGKTLNAFDTGKPDIARVVEVNLLGAYYCTREEAGPHGVRVLSVAPGAVETPISKAVLNDRVWQQDLTSKVLASGQGGKA